MIGQVAHSRSAPPREVVKRPAAARAAGGAREAMGNAVRDGLGTASERLRALDIPVPPLEGKLLRPTFALAMVPGRLWAELDDTFWLGALAIQMAHEASLVHDDVLDGASERRGRPTVQATRGIGAALVLGDHYLTGAYRAATLTRSFDFVAGFSEAVERTVAGEVRQARAVGDRVALRDYDEIITAKSGELFGIAGGLGACVSGLDDDPARRALGRAFGNLYQRIDDLLDYCGAARTGKPPFQDYRQGKWTWVLDLAGVDTFDAPASEVARALFGPGEDASAHGGPSSHGASSSDAPSAARRALARLGRRRDVIVRGVRHLGAEGGVIAELIDACLSQAVEGVARQEIALGFRCRAPDTTGRGATPS